MSTLARLLDAVARRRTNNTVCRLQRELLLTELMYVRISRDLIEQFLIALDQPEHDDYRDRLTTSLQRFNDHVAILEEHT